MLRWTHSPTVACIISAGTHPVNSTITALATRTRLHLLPRARSEVRFHQGWQPLPLHMRSCRLRCCCILHCDCALQANVLAVLAGRGIDKQRALVSRTPIGERRVLVFSARLVTAMVLTRLGHQTHCWLPAAAPLRGRP